ncbi:hypothetical protein IDJ75_05485 [Mucilaginibacter rigui]|uniref:DUF3823 domain-containing protein n=1 Tax=Mucilaginibacter rigui TaxID=534635 RepID=A0ABR7X4G9_9SPHI|nr:hypothetical protein [Mucilaginibacter rigui]MBD1384722.1 hypothetical protein [Mucilaginibacter rigui]
MPKTLITLLAVTVIYISLLACNSNNSISKKNTTKEFEGIITYHEIIKNSDSTFNVDDTVQLFYSHGNYVGIHSEPSSKFHLVKDYYFEKKALRLLLFNNSDTLHQLNLNLPTEKLDDIKVKKIEDQILSRQCEEINVSISYPKKDSTTYSDFTIVFSRGYLNVDKEHFKNWRLGFFNKVIDESGAFYLKLKAVHFDSSHKNILSSKTYDVISVKEQTIDPKIYEIDATKIK